VGRVRARRTGLLLVAPPLSEGLLFSDLLSDCGAVFTRSLPLPSSPSSNQNEDAADESTCHEPERKCDQSSVQE
jgi:hypothetical protein